MLRAVAPPVALPSYTYATLPSASAVGAGYRVRASDIGISPGMSLVSDGTRWIPDGVQVLARANTAATALTGSTSETTLATFTVPANLMGTNGTLRVSTVFTFTNSANNKVLRVNFGGSTLFANSISAASNIGIESIAYIRNRTVSSQLGAQMAAGFTGLGQTAVARPTSSVDTTSAVTVNITGQLALGTESMVLECYQAEVMP